MPFLTRLQVNCARWAQGAPQVGTVGTGPSLCFLAGMPRLRCLELIHLLNLQRWNVDVRYIVDRKELKHLSLACQYNWCTSCHSLTSSQLLPLTALSRLEVVVADNWWRGGLQSRVFQDALQNERKKMGPSPNNCAKIYFWQLWPDSGLD